jgi:predicted NUDIX family NTP pyrophosphohydrolase
MRVVSAMSGEISAGLLVYRQTSDGPEFLLVHPGGPFWKNKDEAAWSIPKGLVDPGEVLWAAALREFAEETGQAIAASGVELTTCRTSGGKIIHAWLVEADLDVTAIHSNSFEMEWPPKSGKRVEFPEVDRAAYFDGKSALTKIHKGQRPILLNAVERLGPSGDPIPR